MIDKFNNKWWHTPPTHTDLPASSLEKQLDPIDKSFLILTKRQPRGLLYGNQPISQNYHNWL